MKRCASRSVWSPAELAILKHLLLLYGTTEVNYERATCLFPNRSAEEIKKRVACMRDLARRKKRRALLAQEAAAAAVEEEEEEDEPDSPTSVIRLPPEGRLHPTLVWVPSTDRDIETMNL